MSEQRKYNADALFLFPLIEDGDADFVGDYTPAAGDAKVFTTSLISTNPTALILGFDSLSELPAQGAQLDENGAGTAEGVVAFTIIVSGTVGGGDAAGFFFMRSVTGQAWSNDDQININGGTSNIATADSTTYDLAATAGLIAILGNGQFAAALSPTEMSCSQGTITIVDSATKAIEDQAILFETYGNASALHAFDLNTALQNVNVTQISGDSTAADNAESFFDGTGYAGTNNVIPLVTVTTTNTDLVSAAVIADAVWDEILTGASHNTATSAGRRLRQLEEAFIFAEGVIATQTDGHTCTLDTGAVATANYYRGARLQLEEGTGAGQSRLIHTYSVGRVCVLDSDWITNPDNSTRYSIVAADVHVSLSDADLASGFVAVYTNTTTITLDDSEAVSTNDYYKGDTIVFTHGTGAGQNREIIGQTGRVITMSPALITALDTTTVFHIQAAVSIPEIVAEMDSSSTIASEVTAILEDTGTTIPALLPSSLVNGRMDSSIDGTGMEATAVDAIWDEAMVETTGAPAITGSMREFMQWWAALSRNKATQTATTTTLRNDADGADLSTSTVSDDGTTFTRGEFST